VKFLRSRLLAPWVPPLPLAFGQICFGASWALLFWISQRAMPYGLPLLGWLHLLTLGWLTTIALAVLTHVIPQFTDEDWRSEDFPRIALLVYMVGACVTIVGFGAGNLALARVGGLVVVVGIALFCVAALPSLVAAMKSERRRATVGWVLSMSLGFLLLTVVMGNIVAGVIDLPPPNWLDRAAGAHGMLGLVGFLSILIMGVSTRTLQPLTGVQDRRPLYHIVAATGMLVGTLLGVVGLSMGATGLTLAAFVLIFAAASVYAMEVISVIFRSIVRHRVPQAFMLAAVLCFVGSAAFGLLAFADTAYVYVAIYLALLGWIGNAILAHLHHIGVRVLLTLYLGDDDETRPDSVLQPLLSASTFVSYQCAVVLGAIGFFKQDHVLVSTAAVAGGIAFIVMVINVGIAIANLPRAVPLS
jgi:hypothetical protein